MDSYDVIVIGAGPAGEVVAGRCADHGQSVAVVERELVGGECSYWGCIPSKTLIRPGDVVAAARRVPGAVEAVTGDIDAAAALGRRDYMTSSWTDDGAVPWLTDKGITLVRGSGRLTGARTVAVERPGGAEPVMLQARRAVVLATGTSAAVPPVEGLGEAYPWDNRGATAAKEIPGRLFVLGGGAIGVEMAQAFRRLGSREVTVVEGLDRLLPREEPFAGKEVREALESEGITVVTGVALASVRRDGTRDNPGPVTATLADGRTFEADEILVAVGRRPSTGELGLETVGLTPGKPVTVDDRLVATSVDSDSVDSSAADWLYAVGDCNGRALLTHMGKYQARIAADVIAGRDVRDTASALAVPRVTFTDPQVSAVGRTEEQARAAGLDVRVVTVDLAETAAAATMGEGVHGTCALVVDESRRVVVGATFVGPGTADLLHAATVAVIAEVPLDTLWHAVPSFPTPSEVWLKLLEAYGL